MFCCPLHNKTLNCVREWNLSETKGEALHGTHTTKLESASWVEYLHCSSGKQKNATPILSQLF